MQLVTLLQTKYGTRGTVEVMPSCVHNYVRPAPTRKGAIERAEGKARKEGGSWLKGPPPHQKRGGREKEGGRKREERGRKRKGGWGGGRGNPHLFQSVIGRARDRNHLIAGPQDSEKGGADGMRPRHKLRSDQRSFGSHYRGHHLLPPPSHRIPTLACFPPATPSSLPSSPDHRMLTSCDSPLPQIKCRPGVCACVRTRSCVCTPAAQCSPEVPFSYPNPSQQP